MVLGYQSPLYVMAFDHRGSFERDLFGAEPPLRPEVRAGITDAKKIIYEGFLRVVDSGVPRDAAGVLVDEQFGTDVARAAKAAGYLLAMPVEKSGQPEFDFFYGEDFGAHIEAFDPNFAKVLVRYNAEGDRDLNARQSERLARLSSWLHERDRKFLFELLVPPTQEQLERCGGDHGRYDRELRPDLVARAIGSLQDSGVNPDIWKIEGLETANDCIQVVAQARTGGRDGVSCIVLGRGADLAKVTQWVEIAAGVPGFIGLAVGRTVWEDALRAYLASTVTRDQAAAAIADRYSDLVDAYVSTARAGVVPTSEPS
jgi:myo-inositol catabolism protein IolC